MMASRGRLPALYLSSATKRQTIRQSTIIYNVNINTRVVSTNTSTASTSTATSSTSGSNDSQTLQWKSVALFGAGIAVGSLVTSQLSPSTSSQEPPIQYPSGMPRACSCESNNDTNDNNNNNNSKEAIHPSYRNLTQAQQDLPAVLAKIVGPENVLDGTAATPTTQTTPFLKGMRLGQGPSLAIVTPRRLAHVYEILPHILNANCVILPQGQNTGLTGGSTPRSNSTNSDSRPTVVISLKYIDTIIPLDGGKRVLCLPGVGLASLDRFLQQHFPDRESHANLGSTFLNPTTAAGIALGSGGTQCLRKGPAFTTRALYLRISQDAKWKQPVVQVVNTLGIKQFTTQKPIVGSDSKHYNAVYKLDAYTETIKRGYHYPQMCHTDANCHDPAHNHNYPHDLCHHNDQVTRFNADTHGIDCNRSEGKVVILATIHDTFPKPKSRKSYWIGFASMELALEFRRTVALQNPHDLPLAVEYVDRDAFDVMDQAGRAMATIISWLGSSSQLVQTLWHVKLYLESLPFQSAPIWIDTLLYNVNNLFPSVLPSAVRQTGTTMDHHVAMTVGDFGDGGMEQLLARLDAFCKRHGPDKIVVHDCSNATAQLDAFRFVAAPAFRTWCVGNRVQGFSVDYVLPKNAGQAPVLSKSPLKRMRYSHFGCNVVHEDLAYAPGVDLEDAKHALKDTVERECGGKLPAEHGHGTEYHAPPDTQQRWQAMDPMNVLNPGVGGLSTEPGYGK
ncbi:Quinone-dependent D-lactate [Seminavis robusta]|uniref:Quinone-dependent D-lactate n=1 Tax=Seminavis robusta TaxID=568900 RepID=A0A9N8HAA5_9STRA|nr:Quinone-dependent D-lactate [Seminavis robusta]|eukprot:Sro312_g114500.1 Quinone-dependent D-lactate (731) ;mRNA; f:13427-15619